MLAPRYDQPQTSVTLESWFRQARYDDIEVYRDGLVIGRGRVQATGGGSSVSEAATAAIPT